jgi:hypothetical protein
MKQAMRFGKVLQRNSILGSAGIFGTHKSQKALHAQFERKVEHVHMYVTYMTLKTTLMRLNMVLHTLQQLKGAYRRDAYTERVACNHSQTLRSRVNNRLQ